MAREGSYRTARDAPLRSAGRDVAGERMGRRPPRVEDDAVAPTARAAAPIESSRVHGTTVRADIPSKAVLHG